ncbi:hypothetical protein Pla110_15800 [Polystyrenella longa]|uniref:Uncharacterized protein n=1 Tax=Polystyrenella longa TaxID=2528007 RepID=A0A518CKV9_9PLAN|nr:hypothetical protein [Polystyrenella longa]QDU79861.1 hypothetical protein Pla110_15800 [Polystyrenella longa]
MHKFTALLSSPAFQQQAVTSPLVPSRGSLLRAWLIPVCCICCTSLYTTAGWSQSEKKDDADQVTIEREPLTIKKPDEYQFRFHLSPKKTAELLAATSGTIKQVNAAPGAQLRAQATLATVDDTRQQLQLAIAAARLNVLKEQKPSEDLTDNVLNAQRELAQAELELAKYELSLTEIFIPFDSKLDRLYQEQGAYVITGTAIGRVIDESQLTVQLPLERQEIKQGDSISIQVESEQVNAKVANISGLPAEWDALRDLASSVAMMTCVIENKDGKYQAGQTVFSPVIPRHAVAEVELESVSNGDQGGRKVQIIRDQTIRNISVETLGQVGSERVFVSGLFIEGDEVIKGSSVELKEGTLVQSVFDSEDARSGKRSSAPKRSNSRQQEF